MTTDTTTARTYIAQLFCVAPYPLSWDVTATEKCDNLEDAMAKAEEWMKRYPKGIANRSRWVEVWSHVGTEDPGAGHLPRYIGRKVHFNSKRKTK